MAAFVAAAAATVGVGTSDAAPNADAGKVGDVAAAAGAADARRASGGTGPASVSASLRAGKSCRDCLQCTHLIYLFREKLDGFATCDFTLSPNAVCTTLHEDRLRRCFPAQTETVLTLLLDNFNNKAHTYM